jgi:solute carrier family 35 protein E2
VLLLSYNILEESQQLKVRLTLIPICLGVTLIIYGEISLKFVGVFCAFAVNLSSASRSVFLKAKLKESSISDQQNSAFMTYLNMGFVSLCLYIPVYLFQLINQYFSSDNKKNNQFLTDKISRSYSTTFDYLIYGSFFNFLYNLLSLNVLSNVAPISHSIINIMKRAFIVFFSMMIFSTRITSLQWSGMICADIGVFLYSMLKISSKAIKVSISNERKASFKKFIIYLAVFILISSIFIGSNKTATP